MNKKSETFGLQIFESKLLIRKLAAKTIPGKRRRALPKSGDCLIELIVIDKKRNPKLQFDCLFRMFYDKAFII